MKDNMKMNPGLDDFSYHEVADRCHLIMDMIQNHLIEHHAMKHHPEQVEILDKAITMVWKVYQNFGGAEREENEKIFDEEHALDQALNAMLEDFSEEEIEEIIKDSKKDKEDGV